MTHSETSVPTPAATARSWIHAAPATPCIATLHCFADWRRRATTGQEKGAGLGPPLMFHRGTAANAAPTPSAFVVPVTAMVVPLVTAALQRVRRIHMPFALLDEPAFVPHVLIAIPVVVATLVDEALPRLRNHFHPIRRRGYLDFDLGGRGCRSRERCRARVSHAATRLRKLLRADQPATAARRRPVRR